MSYEVQIIADSVGPDGHRITTFQLKYPRMIHPEFMTHRMFSRNASSTRAIPTAKMIEWIENDPAMPTCWGRNQKGMQATEELPPSVVEGCKRTWLEARDSAIVAAKGLMAEGVHKQIASRILEPWAHINVVVTATSFDNFFSLRCDKNAMPEIQVLAVKMARAYKDSEPIPRRPGDWHLPYVTACEGPKDSSLKWSVARCARVSYLTTEGKPPDPESDVKLHDTLLNNGHWSPFEHQATPSGDAARSGNFVGWLQYRQTLEKGVHDSFDYGRLDVFGGQDFII